MLLKKSPSNTLIRVRTEELLNSIDWNCPTWMNLLSDTFFPLIRITFASGSYSSSSTRSTIDMVFRSAPMVPSTATFRVILPWTKSPLSTKLYRFHISSSFSILRVNYRGEDSFRAQKVLCKCFPSCHDGLFFLAIS